MSSENKLLILCWLFAILILQAPTAGAAANIHGVVYEWDTFLPAENVVLEVNSTPPQSLVARYGIYSLELETGVYQIEATSYQNNTITHSATETITITDDGDYVMDLLLTPQYSENFSEHEQENTTSSSGITDITAMLPYITVIIAGLGLGGYFLHKRSSPDIRDTTAVSDTSTKIQDGRMIPPEHTVSEESELPESTADPAEKAELSETTETVGPARNKRKPTPATDKHPLPEDTRVIKEEIVSGVEDDSIPSPEKTDLSENNTKTEETVEMPDDKTIEEQTTEEQTTEEQTTEEQTNPPKTREEIKDLPADLREVLEILIKNGGRMTQKELRKHVRYSEGKVSMMIHDLERREWLSKYKKGRGNIIILTDDILCTDDEDPGEDK